MVKWPGIFVLAFVIVDITRRIFVRCWLLVIVVVTIVKVVVVVEVVVVVGCWLLL